MSCKTNDTKTVTKNTSFYISANNNFDTIHIENLKKTMKSFFTWIAQFDGNDIKYNLSD